MIRNFVSSSIDGSEEMVGKTQSADSPPVVQDCFSGLDRKPHHCATSISAMRKDVLAKFDGGVEVNPEVLKRQLWRFP